MILLLYSFNGRDTASAIYGKLFTANHSLKTVFVNPKWSPEEVEQTGDKMFLLIFCTRLEHIYRYNSGSTTLYHPPNGVGQGEKYSINNERPCGTRNYIEDNILPLYNWVRMPQSGYQLLFSASGTCNNRPTHRRPTVDDVDNDDSDEQDK